MVGEHSCGWGITAAHGHLLSVGGVLLCRVINHVWGHHCLWVLIVMGVVCGHLLWTTGPVFLFSRCKDHKKLVNMNQHFVAP